MRLIKHNTISTYISYNIHLIQNLFSNLLFSFSIILILECIFTNLALTLLLLFPIIVLNRKINRKLLILIFAISLIYLIHINVTSFKDKMNKELNTQESYTAFVIYQTKPLDYSQEIVMEVKGLNMYVKSNIDKYLKISQYDEVKVSGEITQIKNLTNYDLSRKVGFEIKKINNIEVIDNGSFFKAIQSLRNIIEERVNESFIEPSNSLVKGILLGLKTNLSEENNSLLKYTGIYHVISVSGSNFTIVFSLFFVLSNSINRKLLRLLGIIFIILYFLVVGLDILPALRAVIMIMHREVSLHFGHMSDSLTSLTFASAIILIIYPFYYLNISYQLSIMATLGIILVSRKFNDLKIFIFKIKENLSQSLGAISFTSFITYINFSEINLNGIITNIFLLPLIPILMATSALTIIFNETILSPPLIILTEITTKVFFLINSFFEKYIGLVFSDKNALFILGFSLIIILLIDIYKFNKNEKRNNYSFINMY